MHEHIIVDKYIVAKKAAAAEKYNCVIQIAGLKPISSVIGSSKIFSTGY